jgi:hypothetical protein
MNKEKFKTTKQGLAKRFTSWAEQYMLGAAKEVLIKLVGYVGIFKLSGNLYEKMRQFWWGEEGWHERNELRPSLADSAKACEHVFYIVRATVQPGRINQSAKLPPPHDVQITVLSLYPLTLVASSPSYTWHGRDQSRGGSGVFFSCRGGKLLKTPTFCMWGPRTGQCEMYLQGRGCWRQSYVTCTFSIQRC